MRIKIHAKLNLISPSFGVPPYHGDFCIPLNPGVEPTGCRSTDICVCACVFILCAIMFVSSFNENAWLKAALIIFFVHTLL